MFIKEILIYDFNYAEYIITDGKNDLRCMCTSVPLPLDKKPEVGMKVLSITAFAIANIEIKRIDDTNKLCHIKKGKLPLEYTLRGKILNKEKALVAVGDLTISLDNDFEKGFSNDYNDGNFIEFTVDRLDAKLV